MAFQCPWGHVGAGLQRIAAGGLRPVHVAFLISIIQAVVEFLFLLLEFDFEAFVCRVVAYTASTSAAQFAAHRSRINNATRMSTREEANQRLLPGEAAPSYASSMNSASAPAVDTSGDAELARRLQMEEQGIANQVRRIDHCFRRHSTKTFTSIILAGNSTTNSSRSTPSLCSM